MGENKTVKLEILIIGITPEILGKPVLWYAQNAARIKEALRMDPSCKNKAVALSEGNKAVLAELLRQLDELGYEKVLDVTRYGEFAHRGGIVDVFPINLDKPIRIEFAGNYIEDIREIERVSDIARSDWEKITGRALESTAADFKEGEYLVHLDHGIGRYAGKTSLNIGNPSTDSGLRSSMSSGQEYFVIEYAKGDRLFVPINLSRKLSRYLGFKEPAIARLGGTLWLKTKRKAREDVLALAKELFDLYAAKEVSQRPSYHPEEVEKDFAANFQHEETPDQLRTVKEIMDDLSKTKPMDRLVCGDVGFGKTEVALRAIFRVVLNSKQAALLAPTTILADQHSHSAKERFEKFGLKIALLTRLQSKSEQKKIIKSLAVGKIDVVIGTHRILSRDVSFGDLGLLVIDEEQRFGVKAKEALRIARTHLDVLSLSATPIPRTFYFALAGLRPISRIQTPPPGRQSIHTTIGPWNKEVVKKAIEEEMARKGQLYFLHNRILTIRQTYTELKSLVPKAKIAAIHGRIGEDALIQTINDMRTGKIDILIATTIIENGLDLARVNTLIVDDASKLGLAQAYQLRGRIGRGHQKAHAYFFWRKKKLSNLASMRLEALKEAEEIGSGWSIAERDMEIRGAGNILGKEQSGNVNRVGLNLYCQMLAEAVEQIKHDTISNSPAGELISNARSNTKNHNK